MRETKVPNCGPVQFVQELCRDFGGPGAGAIAAELAPASIILRMRSHNAFSFGGALYSPRLRAAKADDRLQIVAHVGTVKTLFQMRIERCLIFVTHGAIKKIADQILTLLAVHCLITSKPATMFRIVIDHEAQRGNLVFKQSRGDCVQKLLFQTASTFALGFRG